MGSGRRLPVNAEVSAQSYSGMGWCVEAEKISRCLLAQTELSGAHSGPGRRVWMWSRERMPIHWVVKKTPVHNVVLAGWVSEIVVCGEALRAPEKREQRLFLLNRERLPITFFSCLALVLFSFTFFARALPAHERAALRGRQTRGPLHNWHIPHGPVCGML